jgi:GNAT superfamily N-acetyltransferase
MAHGELYDAEFGWNSEFEALVARIVADFATHHDPAREAAWIAEVDGRRVGCVFCVAAEEGAARLRILLVDPAERGHGVGRRLVDTCVVFARAVGYRRLTLWTNDVLVAARRLYEAAGFPHRGPGPPPQLRPRPRRAELGSRPVDTSRTTIGCSAAGGLVGSVRVGDAGRRVARAAETAVVPVRRTAGKPAGAQGAPVPNGKNGAFCAVGIVNGPPVKSRNRRRAARGHLSHSSRTCCRPRTCVTWGRPDV